MIQILEYLGIVLAGFVVTTVMFVVSTLILVSLLVHIFEGKQ